MRFPLWTRLAAPLVWVVFSLSFIGSAAQKTTGKPLAGFKEIAVEKFIVRNLAEEQQFPPGFASVMQKTTVARLEAINLFGEVIDASESSGGEPVQPAGGDRLVLNGEVISYEKGSRTARVLVGFGAGQAKVTTRFVFTDAATGQEVFRTEQVGTYKGTKAIGGGSEEKGLSESARKTVDGLIQVIKRNR